MGVHGLWQLLQPTGHPVTLESMNGKILAVDVSMWLHQSSKGMRDRHGNPLANAHLIVLFRRICKLLYYHIKPVFVFDGGAPMLKRQALVNRRQHREEAAAISSRSSKKLTSILMKYHAISNAVADGSQSTPAPESTPKVVPKPAPAAAVIPDIFQLPPMPPPSTSTEGVDLENPTEEVEEGEKIDEQAWEERLERRTEYLKELKELHKFNVESDDFEALPADIKHEILTELKESGRKTDWACINSMPKDCTDFSSFQLDRLVKQSRLTQRLESVRQEMNYTASGIDDFAAEVAEDEETTVEVEADRIASDNLTHYVLIKGLHEPLPKDEIAPVEDVETISVPEPEPGSETAAVPAPPPKRQTYLMKDNFVIRKIGIDRNVGKKFAPAVSCVNLSSSSSSDEENEIGNRKSQKSEVPPKSPNQEEASSPVGNKSANEKSVGGASTAARRRARVIASDSEDEEHTSAAREETVTLSPGTVAALEAQFENEDDTVANDGDSSKQVAIEEPAIITEPAAVTESTEPEKPGEKPAEDVDVTTKAVDSENDVKLETETKFGEVTDISAVDDTKQPKSDEAAVETVEKETPVENPPPQQPSEVKINAETGEPCYEAPNERPKILSIQFDPTRIATVDDDLFTATDFIPDEAEEEDDEREEADVDSDISDNTPATRNSWRSQVDNMDSSKKRREETDSENEQNEQITNPFSGMNKDGLVSMQKDLETESKQVQMEIGKQERLATTITNQMQADAQELLRLFGIPYLVSPMEAEAQCAYLDLTDQTHGTATDDSDIWLFGGRRVYRNLFNQEKDVEFFNISAIQSELLIDREMLVNIALLCGSDYTEGIPGVGPVTALEIMAEFPGTGFEKVKNFASWWKEVNEDEQPRHLTKLKNRLKQLSVREGFPNQVVVDAYLRPTIDESKEPFTWGPPDVENLREYARNKLGWSVSQSDELLVPLLKQIQKAEEALQPPLTNYFSQEIRQCKSKRVKRVINLLRGSANDGSSTDGSDDDTDEEPAVKREKALDRLKGKKTRTRSKRVADADDGGFVRRRRATRVIASDESSDEDGSEGAEISDTELAQIDMDY